MQLLLNTQRHLSLSLKWHKIWREPEGSSFPTFGKKCVSFSNALKNLGAFAALREKIFQGLENSAGLGELGVFALREAISCASFVRGGIFWRRQIRCACG